MSSSPTTSSSSLLVAQRRSPHLGRSHLLAALFGLGLGLLGATLFWAFEGDEEVGEAVEDVFSSPLASRIAFAKGTYISGLDEEKRSLLLQTCFKVSDDADEECVHDTLFEGEFPPRDDRV